MLPKKRRIINEFLLADVRTMFCVVCGKKPVDPHHIKTVKSGGHDIDWNVIPLCRMHHTEVHTVGLREFALNYYPVKSWLVRHEWEFNSDDLRWHHYAHES